MVFVVFVFKDDLKIVIVVFVENGYWGLCWVGRIVGFMIEKYLKGEIIWKDMEDFVFKGSLMDEYNKFYSGEFFKIN